MSAFLLSQILIGIAFVGDIASFQFKSRKVTLGLFAFSAYLISAHYFLLDQMTAGLIIVVSATRFLTSIFSTHKVFKYLFLVLVTVIGFVTFDTTIDMFIIAAGYLSTFAAFDPSEKRLRQFMLISTMCVITFNVIIFTPVGIIVEIFFLGSNLLSYWRFYIKKNSPHGAQ